MRNYKKFLAGALAAAMAMSSSVVVFAEDAKGEASGSGSLDVVEQSDIFNVEVPTIPEAGITTFDYILDPTGVIKETASQKYEGAEFAEGKTVYFANQPTTADGAVSYSDASDELKVVNKSTQDVNIKLTASVKAVDGITMANSSTFAADDKTASLYLAVTDGTNTKAITSDGVEISATITAKEGVYETKYEDGKYVKKLKADASGFTEYKFKLTGACNPKGEWTGLKEAPPVVDVVWSVEDFTVTGPTVSISNAGVIDITNLDGDLFQSLTLNDGTNDWPMDASAGTWQWETEEDGQKQVILSDAWKTYCAGKTITVKVTLQDGTTITSSQVEFPE